MIITVTADAQYEFDDHWGIIPSYIKQCNAKIVSIRLISKTSFMVSNESLIFVHQARNSSLQHITNISMEVLQHRRGQCVDVLIPPSPMSFLACVCQRMDFVRFLQILVLRHKVTGNVSPPFQRMDLMCSNPTFSAHGVLPGTMTVKYRFSIDKVMEAIESFHRRGRSQRVSTEYKKAPRSPERLSVNSSRSKPNQLTAKA
jgi:hypothetical protein